MLFQIELKRAVRTTLHHTAIFYFSFIQDIRLAILEFMTNIVKFKFYSHKNLLWNLLKKFDKNKIKNIYFLIFLIERNTLHINFLCKKFEKKRKWIFIWKLRIFKFFRCHWDSWTNFSVNKK